MPKYFLFLCLLSFSIEIFCQTQHGDIEIQIDSIKSAMPGSSGDDYVIPTNGQLADWSTMITHILNNNLADARTIADTLDYEIVEFTDTTRNPEKLYHLLREKTSGTSYWGTCVFNPSPCRSRLILFSSHPKYDTNTGDEGIFCMRRLNNLAFYQSGTHRCNHSSQSSCSGTTKSCDTISQPFQISDMAHNTTTMFQKTTQVIFENVDSALFIQFHGFTKKASDPYVIMSNGTRETPNPDYASILANELDTVDTVLTFKIAHIDTDWTRLIGFTNTQGRMINQSANHCNSSADSTKGQFIHIEQEKSRLRQDSTGWFKMSTALSTAYPCDVDTVTWTGAVDTSWNRAGNWDIEMVPLGHQVVIIPGTSEAPIQPSINITSAVCKKLIILSSTGGILKLEPGAAIEIKE